MDRVAHQDHVWIMQPQDQHVLICVVLLSLLCYAHIVIAETRVLGIRILPFPTRDASPKLHKQFIIRCDVTAYPPVDARNNYWFYENEKTALETGQKYTIYKEPSYGVVHELKNLLTIHGVTSRQLGKYTCYARNSAGMSGNATVKLRADEADNILTDNDDYLHIDSTERNDQIETLYRDVISADAANDVICTSGSGWTALPVLKYLVVSVIAVVHVRRLRGH